MNRLELWLKQRPKRLYSPDTQTGESIATRLGAPDGLEQYTVASDERGRRHYFKSWCTSQGQWIWVYAKHGDPFEKVRFLGQHKYIDFVAENKKPEDHQQ